MKEARKRFLLLSLMSVMCAFLTPFSGNNALVVHANGQKQQTTQAGSTQAGSTEQANLKDYSNKLNIGVDSNGNLTGQSISNSGKDSKDNTVRTGNKIIDILTTVYTLVAAGAAIVLAIIFIVHAVSLGKNASNPQGKSASVNGLILTGVGSALVGGSAVFVALFFNVFR